MGLRRVKQYKRQFTLLTRTYGFSEPIQVLVDASTILEAERIHYDLLAALATLVPFETRLFVSACCIDNLYRSRNELAVQLAKRMQKRFCHHKEPLASKDCIASIVNCDGENKHRFVVITQNEKLRDELRKITAVPLFYIKKGVLVMEPLSKTTKKIAAYVNSQKLTSGLNDVRAGTKRPAESEGEADDGEEADKQTDSETREQNAQLKKKRKVKGVNPLAMKKKKAQQQPSKGSEKKSEEKDTHKTSRRRRHKKQQQDDAAPKAPGAESVEQPVSAEAQQEST